MNIKWLLSCLNVLCEWNVDPNDAQRSGIHAGWKIEFLSALAISNL